MNVYCLVETVERNGIRNFDILLCTTDPDLAKRKFDDCIELDRTGDFRLNGIYHESDIYCESNYVDGFTSYSIITKELKEEKL